MDAQGGFIRGWGPILSLGLMTCTCYGAAFYAYGILIGPIHSDAGWSLTFLGSIFAVSQLIGGFGASLAGRLLDRWGGQLIFQFQALASLGLLIASWMENAFAFAVLTSTSLGVMGACGFYRYSRPRRTLKPRQIDNRTDRNRSLLQPRLPSGRRITHRSPWLAPNN